jgi:ABC-type uncharacterized transport system ATPase subunit
MELQIRNLSKTYANGVHALKDITKPIIVDEPTAGLYPAERVRFLNLLSELPELEREHVSEPPVLEAAG